MVVLPPPCLSWEAAAQELQTLLCPSCTLWPLRHLKLGCKLTQANRVVRTQQDKGTFQLQFTSRKSYRHTAGKR